MQATFSVFGDSLTLGGLSCRWKGGKDRLFGWGSAAQEDPGGGGAQGHQCTCRLQLISPSLANTPFLLRPIIALECTHLTPVKSQTKWKQQQYEMGIWKYLVVRECVDNLILGCQRTAAGILQESHFDKVEALASHYDQSNLRRESIGNSNMP